MTMGEVAITILNFLVSLIGGAVGAYVGLRVAIARLEEQVKSHDKRLDRLEHEYFKTGN